MLRLSRLADYGTVVMVYIARHPGKFLNAREIATRTHLSQPTVSKLLKILSNAGLLTSTRGIKGGYRLLRAPDSISVAEIIHVLEERQGLTECSHAEGACALEPVCEIRDHWQILNHAVQSALESVSLEALAQPKLEERAVDVSQIKTIFRVMKYDSTNT